MQKNVAGPKMGTQKAQAFGHRLQAHHPRNDAPVLSRPSSAAAIGPQSSAHRRNENYQLYRQKEPVLEAAVLDSHDGPSQGASPSGNRPDFDGVSRRALLMSVATGAAAVWWLSSFPAERADTRAIQQIAARITFAEAHASCVEAASMASTLYSQMTSTLRMARGNYLDLDLFQATCQRRLGSPYIRDSLSALQDALPVVGYELAYSPDMSGAGWLLAAVGHPKLDAARKAHFEAEILFALQRCRRVQRMLKTMRLGEYTPAGLEMMLVDLKQLSRVLDTMLAEVPQHVSPAVLSGAAAATTR